MIRILRMAVVAASFLACAAGAQTPQAKGAISAGSPSSLLDMVDKLDKLDRQDFLGALDEAETCTRVRKFSCSELQITKAAKLANGSKDQQALLVARQNMVNEKTRMAEEARLRAEEGRRLAEAEERLRVAQARAAQREQEESESSTASQLFQLGSMISRNYQTNKAASAVENAARSQAFNNMQAQVQANLARDQQRFAEQKAQIAAARQTREQANANAMRQASASTSSAGVAPKPVAQMAPVINSPQSKPQQLALLPQTTNPSTNPLTTLAANSGADSSWKACGPKKRCLAGDGYSQFCSGPFDSGKPMCKSECAMSSGVFYHDTTLPPGNYVPGNGSCPIGSCNVYNEC